MAEESPAKMALASLLIPIRPASPAAKIVNRIANTGGGNLRVSVKRKTPRAPKKNEAPDKQITNSAISKYLDLVMPRHRLTWFFISCAKVELITTV